MGSQSANAVRVESSLPGDPSLDFVTALAAELSRGKVNLPSFPDVAVRILKLLASDRSTIADLVRIASSEPALALRLMKMANSAALNKSGCLLTGLRSAIARLGFNMVRSASISFAMAQVNGSRELREFEAELRRLWKSSTHVAALAYVLAKRDGHSNPDEAFLAGLVHGIGRLYVLTRMPRFPKLKDDPEAVATIMHEWHTSIAKAILENWEMSHDLVDAVAAQDEPDYNHAGPANLADVLIAATQINEHVDAPDELATTMTGIRSFSLLGLTPECCGPLLAESKAEMDSLRQALGS